MQFVQEYYEPKLDTNLLSVSIIAWTVMSYFQKAYFLNKRL